MPVDYRIKPRCLRIAVCNELGLRMFLPRRAQQDERGLTTC